MLGGILTYFLAGHHADHTQRILFSVSLSVTLLAAGVFIICATADWWFRR